MEEYEDNWQTSMGGILFDQDLVSAVLLRGKIYLRSFVIKLGLSICCLQ